MITIVEPGWSWLYPPDYSEITKKLEMCGRTCYKIEERITDGSADKFVRMICRNRHVSVLEHESLTVRIVCSRACSHQIVRHRLASFSQESQRYCNYGKKDSLQVICPPAIGLTTGDYEKESLGLQMKDGVLCKVNPIQDAWIYSIETCYLIYKDLLRQKLKPEDARFLLPNACKTEIVMTMNMRMWRHVFEERALNSHAQWEIRGIFKSIYDELSQALPAIFGDLE